MGWGTYSAWLASSEHKQAGGSSLLGFHKGYRRGWVRGLPPVPGTPECSVNVGHSFSWFGSNFHRVERVTVLPQHPREACYNCVSLGASPQALSQQVVLRDGALEKDQ